MAVNIERYNEEYDAIVNYYKPIIKKNFMIGVILGVISLIFIFVIIVLFISADPSQPFTNGKVVFVLLILVCVLDSLMGKFMMKRRAARSQMDHELNQLELARKQASISDY